MKNQLTMKAARSSKFDPGGPATQMRWCPVFSPGSFGVRVYAAAPAVFVCRVKVRGKTIIRKTGTVSDYRKIADAHADARKMIAALGLERDVTVAKIAADYVRYVQRHGKGRNSALRAEQRLRRSILPALGHMKATDVRRHNVIALHESIDAPVEANRVIATLRSIYNRAQEAETLPDTLANPAKISAKLLNVEHSRDRRVEDHELGPLLEAIDAEPNPYVRALFLLQMHTGLRKGELLELSWSQVDLQANVIRIPDPKNRRPHRVPLTGEAAELLRGLPKLVGSSWVFPGRDPSMPLHNVYKPWQRICKRAGVKDLRPHDLRRSYASWLINDGVPLEVVGDLLNHKSLQTTRAVYAQVSDTAKAEATETLAKIVPLSRPPASK